MLLLALALVLTASVCEGLQLARSDRADPEDVAGTPLFAPDSKANATEVQVMMESSTWDPLAGWGSTPQFVTRQLIRGNKTSAAGLLCHLKSHFPVAAVKARLPHYGTCAVVSSSGVLLRHKHGKKIDSADAVWRFNLAPAGQSLGRMVGNKDTVRIVNNKVVTRLLKKRRSLAKKGWQQVLIVPMGGSKKNQGGALRKLNPKMRVTQVTPSTYLASRKALMSVYDAQWLEQNEGQYEGVSLDPTSGLLGMLTALSTCDRVVAYGMAASRTAKSMPYHYYGRYAEGGGLKANTNSWHRTFPAEKDLWRRLATNPKLVDRTDVVEIPGFSHASC
mmetsp:Transcript_61091/g.113345  ORF Transcript_61091/g.113345 Transcript_61091/m.113345 type:complete len:333 (-) Transcript_61091:69-1067(-)